jgi:hypothetical protein
MDGIGCIYLITDLTNKKGYVGQTKDVIPDKRYKRHWYEVSKGIRQYPLYNAMRLRGKDNFKLEILCNVPIQSLNRMWKNIGQNN